jgi:serine/threonine protein kinase
MEARRIKINDNYSYWDVELGSGAYGTVYKGFSKLEDCLVAVKKLHPKIADEWRTKPNIRR